VTKEEREGMAEERNGSEVQWRSQKCSMDQVER